MLQNMNFEKTEFEGLFKIQPFLSEDERGWFIKDHSIVSYQSNNILHTIKEVFISKSKKGVIRGLHFQYGKPQAKFVRCLTGHIFDVVVDLRADSITYGKWMGFELLGEGGYGLLIPKGFAHGFMALENSEVIYECDECFYPEGDSGIYWNDPTLNIKWPDLVEEAGYPIVSTKDNNLQTFEKYKKTGIMF